MTPGPDFDLTGALERLASRFPGADRLSKSSPDPPRQNIKIRRPVKEFAPLDFTITVHALDRMVERYEELVEGMSDYEIGEFIQGEVMDAIEAGREGRVAPRALSPYRPSAWGPQPKDITITWNEDKQRGYVIRNEEEGTAVLTVLKGRET